MSPDPFSILGIPPDSSEDIIRQAWREKMRTSHPDIGGSHEESISINSALRDALSLTRHDWTVRDTQDSHSMRTRRILRDISSFTIDVLPVECWHLLEIVANLSGSVLVDEPPYLIEFTLHDSGIDGCVNSWCRCEMVPEAGATTVHITVGSARFPSPDIDNVRDYLVSSINELEWDN